MALFRIDQRVRVVDQDSQHRNSVGRVIVITPELDRFFYWLRFDPNPTGGRFAEEQLQVA